MAKAKKKLLPKDFEALLEKGDLNQLKAVFDMCDLNARGGYSKQTALAYPECPDDLTRWLVEQGADIAAPDSYGETPLHSRASGWQGGLEILITLGADVDQHVRWRGTPLHCATGAYNADNVRVLIAHGADVNALMDEEQTPLDYALAQSSNTDIPNMAEVAELLLQAGAKLSDETAEHVTNIGQSFEFHRSGFNPDYLDETDAGLQRLYALFDVPPVPRRALHDGKAQIVVKAKDWREAHEELWALLVPSSGPAETVQGELVRIAGRINDELERNGGVNWDANYGKMADAFVAYLALGKSLDAALLDDARQAAANAKQKRDGSERLAQLAIMWVALNAKPLKLGKPDYQR
jgi:hypothetical protein